MAVLSAGVADVTPLNILKALKGLLGSSWTLDEANSTLWASAPSSFPIGFVFNSNVMTVASKANGVNLKLSCGIDISTLTTAVVTAYTSPGGSVGVDVSNDSGVRRPHVFILKNTNTNASVSSYLGLVTNGTYDIELISPGDTYLFESDSAFNMYAVHNARTYTLVQLADPYTGTALKDIYALSSKLENKTVEPPNILVNGSAKYVRLANGDYDISRYLRFV